MSPVAPLPPEALYQSCTLDQLDFTTTDELEVEVEFIGQDRAVKALELGITIPRQGYNIFALGPSGTGKHALVRRLVETRAAAEAPPDDWCYVNNFQQPYIPHALRLPPGTGRTLQQDMERLIEELRTGLSSAFESEEYQTRRRVLEAEFNERQQESLKALQEQARGKGLTLLRTPAGLAFAPLKDNEVIPPEEFQKLPEEERERVQKEVEALQEELQKVMLQVPRWEREFRSRLRELDNEIATLVVNDVMDDLLEKYKTLPNVLEYLQAVQKDVGERVEDFLRDPDAKPEAGQLNLAIPDTAKQTPALRRYQVNVLVDAGNASGAPVVYETNPSYLNLVGRVEQMAMMGALITDFTLIKPGALHRANGGYLLLDADKVLTSPYAWEGLKRALQFREIRIESPVQMMNLSSTVSLEPEPIALDVKVILLGERQIYYLLAQADQDFLDLFKVAADFDDEFVRDAETTRQYAHLIATIVKKEELLPFDRSAVCRVIEHAARLVEDRERVTARMQTIVDLLQESDHWALAAGATVVSAEHVQKALDAQVYRNDRIRERMQEQVLRETILIDTDGTKVGTINGLSVISMGTYAFGRPSRITATVNMGTGDVVNIEREVKMSGPFHDKGVLILSSFLRSRYAQEQPLSLDASLVFEQSYGGVDGDSASSTELYALLSAIAQVPVKQSLAVTGSVNQLGQVQAIGGVNEKIEGFYDLCNARGLTGDQGVLIPVANVKHLMLRHDVVEAVAAGRFQIYPITTIDEGIEVLTGIPAGAADKQGRYPTGTINRMVSDRLAELATKRREFDAAVGEGMEEKPKSQRKKSTTNESSKGVSA
ncbi:MAG: AAA family ATPase [Caldilineaceae bacterium]|nr:AAA family ATPase [Caldilineaceae bacterium]